MKDDWGIKGNSTYRVNDIRVNGLVLSNQVKNWSQIYCGAPASNNDELLKTFVALKEYMGILIRTANGNIYWCDTLRVAPSGKHIEARVMRYKDVKNALLAVGVD